MSDPQLTLKPHVPTYGPCSIRDLKPGEVKLWCTCGLSKKQPWCDGSHKDTSFRPLKWTVPERAQTVYLICACKYTKRPPICDATHIGLTCTIREQIEGCPLKQEHSNIGEKKLCEQCGFVPDW
ncbi:hypothetical protein I4U23_019558 [Adineta vaga]|nr:hypothetical protein I4U23_019558 [Adineta vaga]